MKNTRIIFVPIGLFLLIAGIAIFLITVQQHSKAADLDLSDGLIAGGVITLVGVVTLAIGFGAKERRKVKGEYIRFTMVK